MLVRTTYNNLYEIKGNTVFNPKFGAVTLDRMDKFESWFGKVIKESENISDLVDDYWIELEKYTDPIFKPNRHIVNDVLNKWIESDKETKTDSVKTLAVYGSIYIKGKGWKHVSKVYVENEEIKEELYNGDGMQKL